MRLVSFFLSGVLCVGAIVPAVAMSLDEAIRGAVRTNPQVHEAAANRRATTHEVRQSQAALLPQVRLNAHTGYETDRRFNVVTTEGANDWRRGQQANLVVSQLLFDGGTSINDIYRQMARSDAASWRTFERTELVALDVVEAYIDIFRYQESIAAISAALSGYEVLNRNINARVAGGRTGIGDAQQVRERLSGARAMLKDYQIQLEQARAAFRRAVGLEASGLRAPARISGGGLPRTRQMVLDMTLADNPTVQAAKADVAAARHQYDAALGNHAPRLSLEGRTGAGSGTAGVQEAYDQTSVRAVLNWDLARGGADVARRSELSERVNEAEMRLANLQRSALQSIERAWAVRERSGARLAALSSQLNAARGVISAYKREYEAGSRSLIDLLNAENSALSARLSLATARSVAVYSDYQLLAAAGRMLAYLNIEHRTEARVAPAADRPVLPTTTLIQSDPGALKPRVITPYGLY